VAIRNLYQKCWLKSLKTIITQIMIATVDK
jgi:hypothetical protein